MFLKKLLNALLPNPEDHPSSINSDVENDVNPLHITSMDFTVQTDPSGSRYIPNGVGKWILEDE